jgi:hypothetical protein
MMTVDTWVAGNYLEGVANGDSDSTASTMDYRRFAS